MRAPGFSIPIHQSLTQPILLAGVPREIAIINSTIGAAVTLGLQSFYALPICLLVHWGAIFLAKKDPYFFTVIKRHLQKKKFYTV